MKNWYGILGGQRAQLHQHIHKSLVDLADSIPTVCSSARVEDARLKKTLVAGIDPVALDAYVANAYGSMDLARATSKNGRPAKFGPARF